VLVEDDHYEIICEVADFDRLAEAFEKKGIEPDSSELAYLPNTLVTIEDENIARKIMSLIESLEELEDVKSVHGNYDMNKTLIEKIS
jgi:transcriptional/translational regulatory protein YebC/TACO1